MSVIENYFKVRYVERLNEFRNAITEIATKNSDGETTEEQYHADFLRIYNQFISTSQLHIKGFEARNVPVLDNDNRFVAFTSKDWLVSFLAYDAEVSEIEEA